MNGSAGRIMSYVCVIVWLNTQQMTNSTTICSYLSIYFSLLSNHTSIRITIITLFHVDVGFFFLYLL